MEIRTFRVVLLAIFAILFDFSQIQAENHFCFSAKVLPACSAIAVSHLVAVSAQVPDTAREIRVPPVNCATESGQAAAFKISGSDFNCMLTIQEASVSLGSSRDRIAADEFLLSTGGPGTDRICSVSHGNSSLTVFVGCTLHLSAGQAEGSYTGSNSLIVSYN
ncbi:MAG: DUF4402 domain-containing protein [Candidatus Wallbacteria bacterium]|nr:DUF4402 domain-containing protein [Candidatus Wallbacteria bacterium]